MLKIGVMKLKILLSCRSGLLSHENAVGSKIKWLDFTKSMIYKNVLGIERERESKTGRKRT